VGVRRRMLLLAGSLVAAFILRGARNVDEDTQSALHRLPTSASEPDPGSGDTFAFEAAARFNEAVGANVDAIDTSLTTILAGNVALLVLMIDKIKELATRETVTSAVFMGLSTAVCIVAYVVGFSFRASNRDGARPRTFIPDLARWRQRTMSTAIADLIKACEDNLAVRFVKKSLALSAIVLLLAGAVMIALARLDGNMVH
jgi:hypothetical protein